MTLLRLVVGVALLVCGIAVPTIIGMTRPDYDPTADFLSELGQTGAPLAAAMNFGGFLPAGLFWAAGAMLLWRGLSPGALGATGAVLLLGNAVSYVGAAVFPCDVGCPASGTISQAMHNLSGAVGYFLTPPALALIGANLVANGRRAFGGATLAVAAIAGVAFAQMLIDLKGASAGIWQRLADFTPFLWMAAGLFAVRRR